MEAGFVQFNEQCASRLQLTLARVRVDTGDNGVVGGSGGNVLALEFREEVRIGLAEGTGAYEAVNLARAAQGRRADLVGAGVGGGEKLARDGGLGDDLDVLEDVSFGDDVGTGADLEGVAGVVGPVVVDLFSLADVKGRGMKGTYSVQHSVTLDLGGTATGVVDVVALHGDHIAGASKVDTPVVVAVAGGRPVRDTVDVGVGDGDAVVGLGAEDDVLATDPGGLSHQYHIRFEHTRYE
jgi:hypothetical protein